MGNTFWRNPEAKLCSTSSHWDTVELAYCEFGNAEPYTDPEWVEHENAITGVCGVIAAANDPLERAERFARLFGGDVVQTPEGLQSVAPGGVALSIGTPERVSELLGLPGSSASGYVALELGSDDKSRSLERITAGNADKFDAPLGWRLSLKGAEEIPLIVRK
ncbi:MAG: hypothetical protein R3C00_04475 [Hyphomonas sp.]